MYCNDCEKEHASLGKWVPARVDMHAMLKVVLDYKMEVLFSVWFMPKCYKQGQSSSGVEVVSSSVE
jgi:hypothetical protein